MHYTDTDTPVIDIAPYEGCSENYWWEEVDEQEELGDIGDNVESTEPNEHEKIEFTEPYNFCISNKNIFMFTKQA